MSDPVSNVEIEDVLSSIRRLVSEDATPNPSEDRAAKSEKADGNANVKLVLTPDFRIVDGTPAQEETICEAPEIENETVDSMPAKSVDGEDSIEDIRHETLESRIAELESTLGEQPGNWEPDGSGFSEDLDAEQMIGGQAQDWVDEIAQETADAEREFEAARKSHQPEFEIDTDHVYTPVPDATPSESDGNTSEFDDIEDNTDFLENDAFLDEDLLREMVSEIVRKELQGALGERITRNVRKLVRREINRVLSNQDFE